MKIIFSLILLFLTLAGNAQNMTPAQAKDSIGKSVTVCGEVMSTYFNTHSSTTYLNLGAAYPNQDLTVVIFADDRHKFSPAPDTLFAHKNVCVTGVVKLYREKPEIILSDPGKMVIK